MSDSFNPNSTLNLVAPKITTISSLAQPYCICTHCNHILTLNHHVGNVAEAEQTRINNAGFNVQSQQSSRWSPTPVQLLVLEELYRQGTKTPTAEQIQQIASQLRQFGKIEAKNVFYWFQNHKARERQKRRRREMEETASSIQDKKEHYVMASSENHEDAGLRGTGCEVKETKKWASTSNCSRHAEETTALEPDIAEKGVNGWNQVEERDLQVKCQNRTPNTQIVTPQNYNSPFMLNRESFTYYEEENADTQTLQLFPLKRDEEDDEGGICLAESERKSKFFANASVDTAIITSNEFFEFLPLRN